MPIVFIIPHVQDVHDLSCSVLKRGFACYRPTQLKPCDVHATMIKCAVHQLSVHVGKMQLRVF